MWAIAMAVVVLVGLFGLWLIFDYYVSVPGTDVTQKLMIGVVLLGATALLVLVSCWVIIG